MKKTTMTGIENLPSITEAEEAVPIPKEIAEQHAQLRREYLRVREAMARYPRKAPRMLRESEEVALANLRAYERRYGLTGE